MGRLLSVAECLAAPIGPPPNVCPPPNADGSQIRFNTVCTLTDLNGAIYRFDGFGPTNQPNAGQGNWEFTANGVAQSSSIALERNTGGQIYRIRSQGPASAPFTIIDLWTSADKPQATAPSNGPVGNVFTNQTTAVGYRTANAMISAAAAGHSLSIPAMPAPIPQWWDGGVVSVANVTVSGVAGAILGGPSFLGQASLVTTASGLTVKNLTLAYGNDGNPTSGVRQDNNFSGLSVLGCTIHDFDHGILTGSSTGGTTSVHDTTIFNCGDLSGTNTHGSTHNAYIGNEDAVDVQNVTSYNTVSGGHTWKTRAKTGTIGTSIGCIFAQLNGDSTCCIDIPCGGNYQITNCILERGPNAENNRFTTFGVEITIAGNCDMVNRTQSITFNGCWFIDDGPQNGVTTQICQNAFAQTGVNVIVQNCKIVSNPNATAVILGPNVTDGGGNIFYASRPAARAAGENIPAVYDGTLACLPPVPSGDALAIKLASMQAGTWAVVGTNTLSTIAYGSGLGDDATLAAAIKGAEGPNAIMADWCGAVFDTLHKQLLVWGGSHAGYFGNEMYAFNCPTLTWKRLTKPADPSTVNNTTWIMGDGSPAVPHTYDSQYWDPVSNVMRSVGAGQWAPSSGGTTRSWSFDPSKTNPIQTGGITGGSGAWVQNANDFPANLIAVSGGNTQMMFHYDPNSDRGWLMGDQSFGLLSYTRATDTWTLFGTQAFAGTPNQVGAIDTTRKRFYAVGAGGLYFYSVDIAGGTAGSFTNLSTAATGDLTIQNSNNPGVAFHSGTGKLVCWNGGDSAGLTGSSSLWIFDPVNLNWTVHAAAVGNATTPTAPNQNGAGGTNGTFGRFQYLASYNCFLLVNDIHQSVYIYKPDF